MRVVLRAWGLLGKGANAIGLWSPGEGVVLGVVARGRGVQPSISLQATALSRAHIGGGSLVVVERGLR